MYPTTLVAIIFFAIIVNYGTLAKRSLIKRIPEHKIMLKNSNGISQLYQRHSWDHNQAFNFSDTKIIHNPRNINWIEKFLRLLYLPNFR